MNEKLHSFGGHALDRHVFDFETVIEPTEADVAASLDPASAGDPAPVDGSVQPETPVVPSPEPEAPAEDPPAAGLTADEITAQVQAGVRAELERLAYEQQTAANQPEPQAGFDWNELDPFDENYGAKLAEGLGNLIKDAVAPLMPVVESTQAREAQEWTDGQLQQLEVADEDRDTVLYFAGGIESAAQAAGLQADGATILQHAVAQMKERDARVSAAAVAKYKAELEGIDGAPVDAGGVTSAIEGLPTDGDELSVARAIAERFA